MRSLHLVVCCDGARRNRQRPDHIPAPHSTHRACWLSGLLAAWGGGGLGGSGPGPRVALEHSLVCTAYRGRDTGSYELFVQHLARNVI
jgi:hypothetical protein